MSSYSVSKHALRVLTEVIDAEYGQLGISAWAVCPGLVDTQMGLAEQATHREYALTADELAEAVRSMFRSPQRIKLGPQVLLRTKQNPFSD
jgi:NAD(P)-dependent dehydrogenase (short-subunit alcohol dehydrogenase family)